MKPPKTYTNPGSFRAAFKSKVQPERFQKLAVMKRFALRLCQRVPGAVVKGGLALELRLERVRTTEDIDVVISGDPSRTLSALREAARIDLGDFLEFKIDEDKSRSVIDTPGMHYKGARFVVRATFGGRSDTDFKFKVEATYEATEEFDVFPCTLVEFPQLVGGELRIYPLSRQLAEKVHAYTDPNIRDDPRHSRYRDLVDIVIVADRFAVDASALAKDLGATFERRRSSARKHGFELHDLPESLPPPPPPWSELYERFAQRESLPWATLAEVFTQAQAFLGPILAAEVPAGKWDPERRSWSSPTASRSTTSTG